MDNENNAQQQSRRRRAWADEKEVIEERGPNGEILKTVEKWIYKSPPNEDRWPVNRDLGHVVLGAVVVAVIHYMRHAVM